MYLKSLELNGFKSFADHTRLDFAPGITAIVGPNGCGKSNVFDSICWVLGEQSTKMLRGTKQEDFIFNGTDIRKPMGMAEVSLTFSDCEKVLGTDYHEITVTRRVFRSGEGHYFINKTPCRLKDIQRLFMDTGIGTSSYSLMGQGRIDLILTSRAEDRREIFEEASGITKYKADRKEALRKLDQTEQNLLRLADIIREVKRQIISLQRQAGKARRYKELLEELRKMDVFAAQNKLATMTSELADIEARIQKHTTALADLEKQIETAEENVRGFRSRARETEGFETEARETDLKLREQLERSQQQTRTGESRIGELEALLKGDEQEIAAASRTMEEDQSSLDRIRAFLESAQIELETAQQNLSEKTTRLQEQDQAIERVRTAIRDLANESMASEGRLVKLTNDLKNIDDSERSSVLLREKLEAENSHQQRLYASYGERSRQMTEALKELEAEVAVAEEHARMAVRNEQTLAEQARETEQGRSEQMSRIAANRAQVRMVEKSLAEKDEYPEGIRKLLDASNPLAVEAGALLGPMADLLETPGEYRLALEAALRAWLDAVVVSDRPRALELLKRLHSLKAGEARLLCAEPGASEIPALLPDMGFQRLSSIVTCPDIIRPLADRLLGNVFVVNTPDDIPGTLHPHAVYVTRDGLVAGGNGAMELWAADSERPNPLSRRNFLRELIDVAATLEAGRVEIENALATLTEQRREAAAATEQARAHRDDCRRSMDLKRGENQILSRELNQARERVETVSWELENLKEQSSHTEQKSSILIEMEHVRARRIEIRQLTEKHHADQQGLEQARTGLQAEVIAANIHMAQHKGNTDNFAAQCAPLAERVRQNENMIGARSERMNRYQDEILDLRRRIEQMSVERPGLEREVEANTRRLQELTLQRRTSNDELVGLEDRLQTLRHDIEEHRSSKSDLTVRCSEARMRKQNLADRILADYKIPPDSIQLEPAPEWDVAPDPETLDSMIAESRAKIEAIGPVNLVAIEEYRELEDRNAMLTRQNDDLVKSKQMLMDMIRGINQTTSEMFAKSFEKINENFQSVFQQLFGGGSAKLMLTDAEDMLECGVEIIASPPGKRLTSISLLSGGERTMTAVALLFAIYMMKPSPFCVLDELDAPLDESNIQRFLKILKGFLQQSQFVLITHNRQTISIADILYGVTMEESKVSRIVSMRFNKQGQPAPATEKEAPAVSLRPPAHKPKKKTTPAKPAPEPPVSTEKEPDAKEPDALPAPDKV